MSTYRYRGVPLTPAVFADVATDLAGADEVISRAALSERVAQAHSLGGGLPTTGAVSIVAKKALSTLQEAGRVERAGAHGYWRFLPLVDPAHLDEPVHFGTGSEAVYVYYLPAYRDQAAYLGNSEWPMKIGMTKGDVTLRIKDQVGTALPERPVVGMIYRTDDAGNAERILHSTLRARAKHIADAPGKEWFLTSIGEVKGILDFATQSAGAQVTVSVVPSE